VFSFYPGQQNVMPGMIPNIYNRSYAISADIEVPRVRCLASYCLGTDGVIVAEGSFLGGFSLYVEAGRPRFTYSLLGLKIDNLDSPEPLPPGKVNVRYEFTAAHPGEMGTGGTGRLLVNGKSVAETTYEHTVPLRFSGYAGMDIGRDNGLPVSPGYYYYLRAPFPFEGTIEKVQFELK